MMEAKYGSAEEVLQPLRRASSKSSPSLPPLPFNNLETRNQKLFFMLPLLCILRLIFYIHRASLASILKACANEDNVGAYLYYLVQQCLLLPVFNEGEVLKTLDGHFKSMEAAIPQARCVSSRFMNS